MSIHLMLVAAYLPKELVNTTQKLVLMKICDSADDQTRLGRPGLERMMAWSGVGEKRVATVVTELVALGLVQRVEVGRVRRRAEYRVFPHGLPPIPSTEELVERRTAARTAPKNPNLARKAAGRAKPSAPARTREDVAAREAGRRRAGQEGLRQGNPAGPESRVPPGEPGGFPDGNRAGSPAETPSVPGQSCALPNPPTPAAQAAGEPGEAEAETACPRHSRPAANCRGCGTNPRAGREQRRRREAAQEHTTQQSWLRQFVADQERRIAETDPEAVRLARARAQELARQGRTQGPTPLKDRGLY